MKKVILFVFIMNLLSSCAGMNRSPLPIEQRTTSYNSPHKMDKGEAFKKTKFWLPLNMKSQGQLIKAEDAASGMIAGEGFIECADIIGSSFADQRLGFSYLVEVDKNTVKIKFTDQRITVPGSDDFYQNQNIFNDDSQIEGVKKCLDRMSGNLKTSLS